MPDAIYSHEATRMRPGERIVVFTDGVTEAEDRSGEFYGDARLESSVLSGASVEVVFRNVQLFMAGAASTDDCTLLEICYGPCS